MDKAKIFGAVDKHKDLMKAALDHIWAHPETGYREVETNKYLVDVFKKLGYDVHEIGEIPGFYTELDTGRPGPKVAVMFELDALINPQHPEAEHGMVHACGHHAQCAGGVGIAAALKEPGMLDGLCGKISLMAVPAEELIEFEYRHSLRKAGKIKYFGGKVEFMRRGLLDDVDIAFMVHTTNDPKFMLTCNKGNNGCITKEVEYRGKAAHAGGAPENGRNALYAAEIGLAAINALRETFKDEDHIRVHPIITAGGESVNIIPNSVKISTYVRGANDACIKATNKKIDRALASGAVAMGVSMHMQDLYGYSPLFNDPKFMAEIEKLFIELYGAENVGFNDNWSRGSTDMAAVAMVVPTVHWYASGASGTGHGADYQIADPERAVYNSAKSQVAVLVHLLENDAKVAKEIKSHYKSDYPSIKDYLKSLDEVDFEGDLVTADDNGNVTLHLK